MPSSVASGPRSDPPALDAEPARARAGGGRRHRAAEEGAVGQRPPGGGLRPGRRGGARGGDGARGWMEMRAAGDLVVRADDRALDPGPRGAACPPFASSAGAGPRARAARRRAVYLDAGPTRHGSAKHRPDAGGPTRRTPSMPVPGTPPGLRRRGRRFGARCASSPIGRADGARGVGTRPRPGRRRCGRSALRRGVNATATTLGPASAVRLDRLAVLWVARPGDRRRLPGRRGRPPPADPQARSNPCRGAGGDCGTPGSTQSIS